MWVRVRLAGAYLAGMCLAGACAVLLSACAVVDPVDSRYDTISRSLAKARNESIFLNIVRASHDYPLSFVTVSNVTPTMTNTSSLGLPTFLFGPGFISANANSLFTPGRDVILSNTTASNSTAVGSNFNVSTQETSAFYQGFLRPIDLQTLDYFIRQGYPRELLFWLFTDSFQLNVHGHLLGYHYAPPDDFGCSREDPKHRCFVDWVRDATLSGLTVEEKTVQKSAASGAPKGGDAPNGSSSGKPQTTIYARFCFNSVLAQQAATLAPREEVLRNKSDSDVDRADLFGSDLTCGDKRWNPLADADVPQPDILPLTFTRKDIVFSIVPRSAYGVFEFLGTLMKMRRAELEAQAAGQAVFVAAYVPPGRQYAVRSPLLITVHEDPEVLQVLRNLGGDCFVHTWFRDGSYCVPEEAATTKRIFALLAQLIAIQTAAGDLSITPIVRVIQ
jgi:hypothetical protein